MIEHSETIGEITKAMTAVQSGVETVPKSGRNTFDNYTYATEPDLLAAVKDLMAENGLALFSSTSEYRVIEGRTTKKGENQNAIVVVMCGLLSHSSGEWVKVYAVGEGQDRGDKASYKAQTGAKKYLLGKLFNLPTGDEPEHDKRNPPKASEPSGGMEDLI